MEIKIGGCYINNTYKYIYPCFKGYGQIFTEKLNTLLFKLALGLGDELFTSEKCKDQKHLFILVDKKWRPSYFNSFIEWVKNHSCYITDYPYDHVIHGRKHMIVVELPPEFHNSYDKFIEGKYSEMYSKDAINFLYYNSEVLNDKNAIMYHSRKVLERSPLVAEDFIKILKERFGHDIDIKKTELIENKAELDLPFSVIKDREIFNYGRK